MAVGRVLALRALGLGDLCTAVPALRALRRAFAPQHITVAAPAEFAPLLQAIDAADEVLPTKGLSGIAWQGTPPTAAVNVHGSGPQSIALLRALRPEQLFSHAHPAFPDVDGPRWKFQQHEVERWSEMLAYYGISVDPLDLRLRPPGAKSPVTSAVVVHPGAAFASRRWPAERYAAIARWLIKTGENVIITGNKHDVPTAKWIAQIAGLPPERVWAGRTDVATLAALVAEARMVICGDTGVAHLANGYGTPSVVLFGPASPAQWGPLLDQQRHAVLWAGSKGDRFANSPDDGLLRITVSKVIHEVEKVRAKGGGWR